MHYTHCIRLYKFDEKTGKYLPTKGRVRRSPNLSDACQKLDDIEEDYRAQNISVERRRLTTLDIYIVEENGRVYLDKFYTIEEDNHE